MIIIIIMTMIMRQQNIIYLIGVCFVFVGALYDILIYFEFQMNCLLF